MAGATIDVDPILLRWARESAGLSPQVAAKKVGVSPGKFGQWETAGATERPTANQLEKLADAVKRPVAAFFLPSPPQEPALPADFRRATAAASTELSFAVRLAIRRARRLRGVFAELAEDLAEKSPKLSISATSHSDPEKVAAAAREQLDVSIEQQSKWKEPEVALKAWRERLEALGVLVFQFAMPADEISGLSLSEAPPAVVLNKKDSHGRRCFTLFHEWAHLLLGEPGLCFIEEGRVSPESQQVEVFCNAFAASVLVPMRHLRQLGAVASTLGGASRRLNVGDAVEEGVRRFAVSRYVILRRLLSANTISREEFQRTAGRWDQERGEAAKRPKKKSKGGPAPHVKAVSELGARFVSRVLRAHDHGQVSDMEIADYLSLKLRHLEKLEALVDRK